jgi:hypothetical protein
LGDCVKVFFIAEEWEKMIENDIKLFLRSTQAEKRPTRNAGEQGEGTYDIYLYITFSGGQGAAALYQ